MAPTSSPHQVDFISLIFGILHRNAATRHEFYNKQQGIQNTKVTQSPQQPNASRISPAIPSLPK